MDGEPGNLLIEGDNRQAMVSLMGQWRGKIDAALLDVPHNSGNQDLLHSDARFHDPDADGDDAAFVSNTDGGRHTKWLNPDGADDTHFRWFTDSVMRNAGLAHADGDGHEVADERGPSHVGERGCACVRRCPERGRRE